LITKLGKLININSYLICLKDYADVADEYLNNSVFTMGEDQANPHNRDRSESITTDKLLR